MADNSDAQSTLRQTLDKGRRTRNTWIVAAAIVLVAAIVAVVLWATGVFGGQGAAGAADPDEGAPAERLSLRLATAEDSEYQDAIAEVAAGKGLDVEWVNVDDWVLPNTELVAGTVDGNAFQHILYLSAFNVESDADITPVFSTVITQWGIFSATLDELDAIADGARVAIPDDPSNGGRALFILEAAGLIELDGNAGEFPTVEDITANTRDLELVEIAARSIPQQFDDPSLSAVVVGTSYFEPSQGIDAGDALFLDDSLAEQNLPYVNVVASRADNVDDPAWKVLEEAYADPRVAEALERESFGNTVPVEVPVETLRAKLADLEALAKASS